MGPAVINLHPEKKPCTAGYQFTVQFTGVSWVPIYGAIYRCILLTNLRCNLQVYPAYQFTVQFTGVSCIPIYGAIYRCILQTNLRCKFCVALLFSKSHILLLLFTKYNAITIAILQQCYYYCYSPNNAITIAVLPTMLLLLLFSQQCYYYCY